MLGGLILDEDIKSLIIIGNGFDAACGLHSNFLNFFNTIKTDLEMNNDFLTDSINYEDKRESSGILGSSFMGITQKNDSFLAEESLRKLNRNVEGINFGSHDISSSVNLEGLQASSCGFWADYFELQNELPKYWYDVENILGDFFEETSDKIGIAKSVPVTVSMYDKHKTRFEGILEYIDILTNIAYGRVETDEVSSELSNASQSDIMTQKLAYLLINVYDFKSDKEELSEFLLKQLKKFEQQFSNYLSDEVNSNTSYKEKRTTCLENLSGHTPYNLLNFNYTTPETKGLNVTRNVHSTLDNGPIFGIDSDDVRAEEEYYKFTKTYRIMRLATGINDNELLPKSINRLIFYGHSLSNADYSYFQAIFDYYDIYSKNIELIFYYSKYDGKSIEEIARDQFDKVSSLLENYGSKIPNKGKNLLPKLLLESRIKILELSTL